MGITQSHELRRARIDLGWAQVATTQKFRKGLPEGCSILVCKNNLMKVAVQQSNGWGALAEKGCTVSGQAAAARALHISDRLS